MRAPDGYRLGEAFDRDRTGTFHRGIQVKLNRPVTIKLLREELKGDERARAIFLEERVVTASLEHANILLTLGVGEVGGLPYFVTESIAEPTLEDALSGEELPSETAAVAIAIGIAKALEYLARRDLICKNVSPRNILLPRPLVPKLLTFRNVRSTAEAPRFRGAQVQSGAYCAPELVRSDLGPVTIKANVYALGGILYHLLAGVPPVEGGSGEAREAHAAGRVRPLKEVRPFLRDRAHSVVASLMSHDPAQRPDAGGAVALLEAYANDPLVTRPLKTRRKRRRQR
jgi:serine/threonine-protein kinase